ncbi:MAG: GyrI-like domain-containing protein [Mycetocola sp.]
MTTLSPDLKPLPAQVVAQTSATAPGLGPENISPIIGPLFTRLFHDLTATGLTPGEEALAMYEELDPDTDGAGARAYAAYPVPEGTPSTAEYTVTEVPGVELAVTVIHHGVMATIGESWDALFRWISENGYEPSGMCREVYLASEPLPQEEWVTELQQPVVRT